MGLLLLPFCVALTRMVLSVIRLIQPESTAAVPPSAWALGGGFVCWILLYFTMPRPARSYVLAHELTHALWGLMMGARVSKMRISKEGGSVTLSKSNMFITLAPYFFPLYTVLVIIGYYILSVFFPVEEYYLFWLCAVGFSWGFHFTFTISTLMQHQSDIKEYGALFSYSVIYLFNVFGIVLWIILVSAVTLEQTVEHFWIHLKDIMIWCWHALNIAVDQAEDLLHR